MTGKTPAERFCEVTLAVLNYDRMDLVERLAASVLAQELPPARILFIDNGSVSFSEARVHETFAGFRGELEILRIIKNLGYAEAFNLALACVLQDEDSPAWVLTLNNDTELDPGFFSALQTEIAAAGPKVGMLSPKVRRLDAPDTIDSTGIQVCVDGMSTARGQNEKDRGQYDDAREILVPSGVAAVYRLDMLREIGLFDETYHSYCEDTDLGLRGWLAGWDCRYAPQAMLYHERSATNGRYSLKKLYLVERNHFRVALKCFPAPFLLLNPVFTGYRYLLQAYAVFAGKGQGEGFKETASVGALLWTSLRAMAAAVAGIPWALLARRGVWSLRKRSRVEIWKKFWSLRLPLKNLIN